MLQLHTPSPKLWTPPMPSIKRHKGLLVDGHKTNWINCGRKHGETRFRIRGFFPDKDGYGVSCKSFVRHFIDDPEDAEDFWRRLQHAQEQGYEISHVNDCWPSWLPSPQEYPGLVYEFATVTFLTSTGTHNYTIPADWNSANNLIEGIGGGGSGIGAYYCSISNETHAANDTVSYTVGAAGGDTQWPTTASTLLAPGGGSATAAIGTVKYAGGVAGNTGGGGGGAGAPSGAGKNGGAAGGLGGGGGGGAGAGSATDGVASTANPGKNGGVAQDGTAGGAGAASTPTNGSPGSHGSGGGGGAGGASATATNGGAGGNGIEWDSSHGAGGGGGGSGGSVLVTDGVGGNGGLYGGGNGLENQDGGAGGGADGTGAQGIIVVTYTPAITFSGDDDFTPFITARNRPRAIPM